MSSQLSALSSQSAHGKGACNSLRKTDLTQRRKDAKTRSLGWSVPVSSPAPADFVRARLCEQTVWRTSSPARLSHHRGTLRVQPDSHRRISLPSALGAPFDRSAEDGRSPRRKVGKWGGKFAFRAMRRPYGGPEGDRRTPGTVGWPPFAALRLCAFAFLSSCLQSKAPNISEAPWL